MWHKVASVEFVDVSAVSFVVVVIADGAVVVVVSEVVVADDVVLSFFVWIVVAVGNAAMYSFSGWEIFWNLHLSGIIFMRVSVLPCNFRAGSFFVN